VSCGDVETGTDENRVPPGEYVARARAEGSAGVQPAIGGSIEDVEWVTRHVLFPGGVQEAAADAGERERRDGAASGVPRAAVPGVREVLSGETWDVA
jgi:hypothetical protein